MFYLYGLDVNKLLRFNLDKGRQAHTKLNHDTIVKLKQDLENNSYCTYSEIGRKYNIRVDSLHKYIQKYNIHVLHVGSDYKKSSKHLNDFYEKWLKKISQNGIKKYIYDELINKQHSLDTIYQKLINNPKGYCIDKYQCKYCPLAYYVNLNFKEHLQLPDEEWRDYHDELIDKVYSSFKISNYGRILTHTRNRKQQHMICGGVQNRNYLNIHVRYKQQNQYYRVHQLVARCFIPNPQHKPYIDHINTITSDNRVNNLQWVTIKENNNNQLTKFKSQQVMYKRWKTGKFSGNYSGHILSPCVAINLQQNKTYYFASIKSLRNYFDYHSHTLKERWFNKGFIQSKRHKLYGWSFNNITDEEYKKHRYLDPTLK